MDDGFADRADTDPPAKRSQATAFDHLVGRQPLATALQRLIADATTTAGAVFLEGEAGIGKSTLVDATLAVATANGLAIGRATADELTAQRPLGLLSDLLGSDLRELVRIDRSVDPDEILDRFEAWADGRPLVVALDDLQWADVLSLAVLASLTPRLVAGGITLVAAARPLPRPAELDGLIDRLQSANGSHLRVTPLSDDDVLTLGAGILGSVPTLEQREALARGGGNPFFVGELARSVAGGVDFHSDDEALGKVPDDLRATVIRRVRSLGADVLEVLTAAAVLGPDVGIDALSELAEQRPRRIDAAIENATVAGLLAASPKAGHVGFAHDLVREALADHVPELIRQRFHAAFYRRQHALGEAPEQLATHVIAGAVNGPDAIETLILARLAVSPDTALRYVDHALELARRSTPPLPRDELLRLATFRCDALLWNGRPDDAIATARAALAQFDEAGAGADPSSLVWELRTTISHALFVAGRADEAVDSWVRSPVDAPPIIRAGESAEMAFASLFAGRLNAARDLADEALAYCAESPAGEPRTTAQCIASLVLGWVRGTAGDIEGALTVLQEAIALSVWAGPTAHRLGPHLVLGTFLSASGRTDEALASVARDEADASDDAQLVRVPFRHALRAVADYRSAAWDDALAEVEAGLAAADDLKVHVVDSWLRSVGSLIAVRRGQTDVAARFLEGAAGGALGSDWLVQASAELARAAGDDAKATELLGLVCDIGMAVGSRISAAQVAPDLVRGALALGRRDRAEQVRTMLEWIGPEQPPCYRGVRRWVEGLLDGDASMIESAADLLVAWPIEQARAWVDAAALGAGGTSRLGDAIAVFESVGATALVDEALRAVPEEPTGPARRRSASAAKVGWDAVTATERRVLALVGQGLSNAEVAAALVVSRRTVESHLAHVYAKVGISSRIALVRYLAHHPVPGG